jgi:non-homologous end joining protein Ku
LIIRVKVRVDSKELSLGKTLVENLTTEEFDLGQYSDSYAKESEKLIQAKAKGQKVIINEREEEPKETPRTNSHDLTYILII